MHATRRSDWTFSSSQSTNHKICGLLSDTPV